MPAFSCYHFLEIWGSIIVLDPKRRKYEEFYKNYNAEKVAEQMWVEEQAHQAQAKLHYAERINYSAHVSPTGRN